LYVAWIAIAANDFIELLLRAVTLAPLLGPARFAGAEEFFNLEMGLTRTGDVQWRFPFVKSIALTAVMPTSIRMAASKTKTIKEALLVLLRRKQVCRQAVTG